jgi:acetyl-CoA carboxylase biotin carboxyl carrier protein
MFWSRADPDGAPFCDEGQAVQPETEIGVVEVMKMFIPQEAGAAGRFLRYLVADGDLVDAGDDLAEIADP